MLLEGAARMAMAVTKRREPLGTKRRELLATKMMAVHKGEAPPIGGVLHHSVAAAALGAVVAGIIEAPRTGMPDHRDVPHRPNVAFRTVHRRGVRRHRAACHRAAPNFPREAATHRLVMCSVIRLVIRPLKCQAQGSGQAIITVHLLHHMATVDSPPPQEGTPSRMRR